jgi:hypothetical protein
MLVIQCFDPPPRNLLPMASQLACLCNHGSEMQELFQRVAHQQSLPSTAYSLHIAIAFVLDDEDSLEPWGWAALCEWDGKLCLQHFVTPGKRGRSLATALTTALFLDRGCPETLCVFAPVSARIATRLGVADVRLYKQVADGWLRSEYDDNARRDEPE